MKNLLRTFIFAALFIAATTAISLADTIKSGAISAEASSGASGFILKIADARRESAALELFSAENVAAVSFKIDENTWDDIAGVEQASYADTKSTISCLTKSGRKAIVTIDLSPDQPSLNIAPDGWRALEIAVRIKSGNDEDFFGGGEVWNESFRQRGRSLYIWAREGTPDECCYIPFYFSTAGYGVYADTYERGIIDFCAKDARFVEMSFVTSDNPSLTLRFIPGPNPYDIIKNYTAFTGRPPLPPAWSFLPWKWRDKYENWDEVFADANGMRDNNIPCSIIWIDNPWQKYGLNSFEFDPVRFPDAQKRIDELKAMGYKVLVWVSPFTTPSVPNYEIAAKNGYIIKDKDGNPYAVNKQNNIDLTNPAAYEWWKGEMKKVIRMGIDGFKLDRGQNIPLDSHFSDGATGSTWHNKYALLYSKVCWDALKEERGDDFVMLPRAGCAGSQSYTNGKWPGDLAPDYSAKAGLASSVIAGQSIAVSGFPFWGSDIGGFERGGPDKELLCRWSQFGCFSPIMQLGGQDSHEPWDEKFGPDGLAIYRFYATLHTELLPYTYSYAIKAHELGVPIIRPLVLEYMSDKSAIEQNYEYLYGRELLIAPVVTDEDVRDVYLPEGLWVDFWNWNTIHEGRKKIMGLNVPLNIIPVYVRNGSLIPMLVENDITGFGNELSKGKLTILAFPFGKTEFTVADSGKTFPIWMKKEGKKISISWKNATKPLMFRVRARGVKSVSVGKKALLKMPNATYTGAPGTWTEEASSMRVLASPPQNAASLTILQTK